MTMIDVCDLTDLTADGVTIRFREQRHIDALQAMARRARKALTEHGDFGVPGMTDRVERLESAVGELSVISDSHWDARQVTNVCAAVNSIVRLSLRLPDIRTTFAGGDLDMLSEAAEPLFEALRLMSAMRLAQAGGAA